MRNQEEGADQPLSPPPVALVGVIAHVGIAGATAAGWSKAQEFLSPAGAIHLANVNISIGVRSDHVRPVEFARLAAAATKTTDFR